MSKIKKYRYLISRRIVQIAILVLFWGANHLGWRILTGNLSTAKVLDKFYLADPFSVLQILATGTVISLDILIGVIIIVLFYALFAGRSFCSWVCPVNIVTDSAAWLRRKGFGEKGHKYLKVPRSMRFYILLLALILSVILGVAAYEVINPIGITVRGVVFGFGISGTVLLMIFLFDLYVLKNGFCGHLCPVGGLYSLISKFRLLKVKLDNDKCTSCMDCKTVCPEVQVLGIVGKKSGYISQGECTNCGRCIEVCEDDALGFKVF